jgi:DNA ligase (NAD+)
MKSYLKRLSKLYYDGTPEISNEEYEALEAIYGQTISGSGDIKHAYRMFSLKKHYDKDGALPLNRQDCVKTPKLDGAAISVLYIDGEFQHALTRGDGIMGRDVSIKLMTLNIPETIPHKGVVQVTGEVVASKDVENSRNYASGALNQKDMDVWEQRKIDGNMRFVAYNVQIAQNRWGWSNHYEFDMDELSSIGFSVITENNWEDMYPTDGIVYRLGNSVGFNAAGFTDKFPRGAIAWKEEQESVQTTLLSVEWQVGKSGKVSPVAILDTVVIGEANISRATLNNQAYIEALDLELGCAVEVIRSGEIIPKIIGRVYV